MADILYPIVDTFTDDSNTNLTDHSSDRGNIWTAWEGGLGTGGVITNNAIASFSEYNSPPFNVVHNYDIGDSDHYSQLTVITNTNHAFTGGFIVTSVRHQGGDGQGDPDSATNYYYFALYPRLSGVNSQLGVIAATPPSSNTIIFNYDLEDDYANENRVINIRGQVVGNTLSFLVDGVEKWSGQNDDLPGGNYVGFQRNSPYVGELDNFIADTIPTSSEGIGVVVDSSTFNLEGQNFSISQVVPPEAPTGGVTIDSFTDDDNTNLESHDPDCIGSWFRDATRSLGQMQITNNAIEDDFTAEYIEAGNFSSNHWAALAIDLGPGKVSNSTTNFTGIDLRNSNVSPTARTRYSFRFIPNETDANCLLNVQQWTGTSLDVVLADNVDLEEDYKSSVVEIKAVANYSSLEFYVDDVLKWNTTDTNFLDGDQIGIVRDGKAGAIALLTGDTIPTGLQCFSESTNGVLIDSFTNVDFTNLQDHSPNCGGMWVARTQGRSNAQIINNRIESNTSYEYTHTGDFTDDHWVSTTLDLRNGRYVGSGPGAILVYSGLSIRNSGTNKAESTRYEFIFISNLEANTGVLSNCVASLEQYNGLTREVVPLPRVDMEEDYKGEQITIKAEAEGTTLRFYVNDVLKIETTDTNYTSGSYVGVVHAGQAGYVDTFRADTLPAGSVDCTRGMQSSWLKRYVHTNFLRSTPSPRKDQPIEDPFDAIVNRQELLMGYVDKAEQWSFETVQRHTEDKQKGVQDLYFEELRNLAQDKQMEIDTGEFFYDVPYQPNWSRSDYVEQAKLEAARDFREWYQDQRYMERLRRKTKRTR